MSVKMRQIVEKEITTAIVEALLKSGFSLSTDYGDGESRLFRTKAGILDALFQGDEDRMYVYQKDTKIGDWFGWVYLVYGNDGWADVLSDYTTNLEKYIGDDTPVQKLIDKYAD
jgi:hypothetical protein